MKFLFVISAVWCLIEGYRIDFRSSEPAPPKRKGSPLILTPYIQNGSVAAGREAAKVQLLSGVDSYSGFFTVNSSSNGNLFFWYFPAEVAPEEAPVMIWLQGGPGGSSMYGLFLEHGPLQLNGGQVSKRKTRWTQNIHMIYVDNPVGTGFSFSDRAGYSTNEDQVSTNLYESLVQFFQLFPELSENEFFVAGESYAGKYVPFLADKIHRENPKAEVKINLKGLAIGDGVVDPMPMMLGHEKTYKDIVETPDEVGGNHMDLNLHHNLERRRQPRTYDELTLNNYLNREDVQRQIHVNGLTYDWLNGEVMDLLDNYDWNTPVTSRVEELLNHYQILYYNGKVDPIINYKSTQQFAEKLNWSGSQKYRSAAMIEWVVDGKVAGNVKTGGNLTLLQVNKAGHMVPQDQPEWALHMINKFVKNEPLA